MNSFLATIFFATKLARGLFVSGLLATVLFATSSPSSARAADEHWVWAAQHAVGSHLPDFTAKDSQGKKQRLSALLGKQGTLVLFNRSADW